jgi:hypothetical protein
MSIAEGDPPIKPFEVPAPPPFSLPASTGEYGRALDSLLQGSTKRPRRGRGVYDREARQAAGNKDRLSVAS